MPDTYLGRDVVMKIDVSGTATQVEELTAVTLEPSANLLETTAIGNAARTRKAGLEDYTLNYTFFQDSKSPAQSELIEGDEFEWEGYFEGEGATKWLMFGTAIVESVTVTGEIENIVEKQVSAVNQTTTGLTRIPYQITISGTVVTGVDGVYVYAGKYNDFAIWEFGSSSISALSSGWFVNRVGETWSHPDSPPAELPPKSGWPVSTPGGEPAPTLTY